MLQSPRTDQAPHFPIAHERIPGIRKRGWTIFLQKEMADPRAGIAGDQRCEQEPITLHREREENLQDGERRAEEMQNAIRGRSMFAQIERPKFCEALILFCHLASVFFCLIKKAGTNL